MVLLNSIPGTRNATGCGDDSSSLKYITMTEQVAGSSAKFSDFKFFRFDGRDFERGSHSTYHTAPRHGRFAPNTADARSGLNSVMEDGLLINGTKISLDDDQADSPSVGLLTQCHWL